MIGLDGEKYLRIHASEANHAEPVMSQGMRSHGLNRLQAYVALIETHVPGVIRQHGLVKVDHIPRIQRIGHAWLPLHQLCHLSHKCEVFLVLVTPSDYFAAAVRAEMLRAVGVERAAVLAHVGVQGIVGEQKSLPAEFTSKE